MSRFERFRMILSGLLMFVCCGLMIRFPDMGYLLVLVILSFSLTLYGIRKLIFYFTMARYMVGGKTILYIGLIALDLGMFTMTLDDIPRVYIMLYLVFCNALSGGIDIIGSLDAKRMGSLWKLKFSHGIVSLAIAVLSVIFFRSADILVFLYCTGMIYSGCVKIMTAVRKTAIVYIQ